MGEYQHISHTFQPVFNEQSRILILGSFPSVKSREEGFYYGHPRNRFWQVMAAICDGPVPQTIDEKKTMLLANHYAIWDVIDSCDIIGSSDSSIRNVIPADIAGLVKKTQITKIILNGQTAGKLYRKHIEPYLQIDTVILPSTSPANAASSLDTLIKVWREAIVFHE